jgi:hypothetical protein
MEVLPGFPGSLFPPLVGQVPADTPTLPISNLFRAALEAASLLRVEHAGTFETRPLRIISCIN